IGLLAIALCMGQSCPFPNGGAGDDTGGDPGDDSGDSGTAQQGIPEGIYTGVERIEFSLDNLSDALPAETGQSNVTLSFSFDKDGKLLRPDGKPLTVGDLKYTDTQIGRVYETVSSIRLAGKLYEYRSTCTLVMQSQVGLVWNFTGTGIHTYRLAGGQVLYDGSVAMTSDVAGGAAYEAVWEFSATLIE
ncbi:MAG: hypothetical protein HRF43_04590, partial [Phycisphaerae bacterium]